MTRRRAYQLLDASRILENVSTLVDTDPTSGEAVKKVLLAANKAIAHLNEEFVNEIPEPSVIVKVT